VKADAKQAALSCFCVTCLARLQPVLTPTPHTVFVLGPDRCSTSTLGIP